MKTLKPNFTITYDSGLPTYPVSGLFWKSKICPVDLRKILDKLYKSTLQTGKLFLNSMRNVLICHFSSLVSNVLGAQESSAN